MLIFFLFCISSTCRIVILYNFVLMFLANFYFQPSAFQSIEFNGQITSYFCFPLHHSLCPSFLPSFLISEYLVGCRFSKSCYTIMRPIKSNFNSYYFKYFESFYIPFYSKHTHCTGVMVMAFPAPLSFVCSHICIFK